jgi:hypothetical protein
MFKPASTMACEISKSLVCSQRLYRRETKTTSTVSNVDRANVIYVFIVVGLDIDAFVNKRANRMR